MDKFQRHYTLTHSHSYSSRSTLSRLGSNNAPIFSARQCSRVRFRAPPWSACALSCVVYDESSSLIPSHGVVYTTVVPRRESYDRRLVVTHADFIAHSSDLSLCLSVRLFVRSITKKRMIPKFSNSVYRDIQDVTWFWGLKGQR